MIRTCLLFVVFYIPAIKETVGSKSQQCGAGGWDLTGYFWSSSEIQMLAGVRGCVLHTHILSHGQVSLQPEYHWHSANSVNLNN